MAHLSPVPSDPKELVAWLIEQAGGDPRAVVESLLQAGSRPLFEPFRNEPIELPPAPAHVSTLTVKVALTGVKPPIWRRVELPGDLTLPAVHEVLQTVMGWYDFHLHRFYPGTDRQGCYFVTEFDLDEGDDGTLEDDVRLDQLLREPGDQIRYDYDFGDGWTHLLTLEDVAPGGDRVPRCVAGRRACPPEDLGGSWSHNELVAWFATGSPGDAVPEPFDSVEQLRDWLPLDYDPAAFDLDAVNASLSLAQRAADRWGAVAPELRQVVSRLAPWGRHLADAALADVPEGPGTADLAAGVRGWRVLLEEVGDGVQLTAAGYLPPAVVERVFHRLEMDQWWIGKGNREDHTPEILNLREVAQRLGLLRKARGRLAPTAAVRRAGDDDRQLWEHVRKRLPLGKDAEYDAGWLALLALAAGLPDRDAVTAEMLTAAGWQRADGQPLDEYGARRLSRATVDAVIGPLRWNADVPDWAIRLAADVVRGGSDPA